MFGRVEAKKLHRPQWGLLAATLLLGLQVACSANAGGLIQNAPSSGVTTGLPALPVDRQAKVLTPNTILGKDYASAAAVVTTRGNAIDMAAPVGGAAWAIYQFVPGSNPLTSLSVDATLPAGAGLYVGLADYGRGVWQFDGPLAASRLQGITLAASNRSPAGNFYCIVVAYGGVTASVNQLTVTTDNPVLQFSVGGTVTAGGTPLAGVALALTGQATQTSGADGKFAFASVPNGTYTLTPTLSGYTFTPATRSVTVNGANVAAQNFSGSQSVTYTSSIQAILTSSCVACHGSGQAYAGIKLNTYSLAKQNGSIANAAIQNDNMPFGGPPLSAALKAQFQAWVDAGFPQ